jgi:ribosomal protein L13E
MSASGKKKAKPGMKKTPTRKKAKVTRTKKVVKAPVEEKPKKAAKAKKAVEKKEVPPKTVVKEERVKLGPSPIAVISARHIDSLRERPGRGFSFGELSSAGVPLNAARRHGLSLDIRRRSVVEGNVEMLKGWFKNPKNASAGEETRRDAAVAAAVKKK